MHTAPSPANNLAGATSILPLDPARTTTPQPVCSAGFRMEPWRSLERLASWTFMAIPLHPAQCCDSSGAGGSCPRTPFMPPTLRSATAAAEGQSPSARSAPGHARERVVEMDGRAHRLEPVAEVEALVLGMGLRVGIGHAHQDARRALEEIGERLHEADGAPRADHRRLLAEARLEGAARGL